MCVCVLWVCFVVGRRSGGCVCDGCVCVSCRLHTYMVKGYHITILYVISQHSSAGTRRKLKKYAIGFIICLSELNKPDIRHFQSFLFSHFTLIDAHLEQLKLRVEEVCNNRNQAMIESISKAYESFLQNFLSLYRAPRIEVQTTLYYYKIRDLLVILPLIAPLLYIRHYSDTCLIRLPLNKTTSLYISLDYVCVVLEPLILISTIHKVLSSSLFLLLLLLLLFHYSLFLGVVSRVVEFS